MPLGPEARKLLAREWDTRRVVLVWVDSWQQQCCGDEFRVGSPVEWDVLPEDDESMVNLLGAEWSGKVGYRQERHGPFDHDQPQPLSGVIRSIATVTYSLEPVPGKQRHFQPAPGTGALRSVSVADPWGPEPPASDTPTQAFGGWIVELETI